MNKYLISFLLLCCVTACTTPPKGLAPITGFDINRYLGKWYEIARLNHSFERGLSKVTAEYQLREEGGVTVINRGYDEKAKEWKEAVGKAFFVEGPDVGQLKVSFFGPFYGGYTILELDKENYEYALVSGPNRSYLWLLARSPDLDTAIVKRLVTKAERLGFPVDELIYVTN